MCKSMCLNKPLCYEGYDNHAVVYIEMAYLYFWAFFIIFIPNILLNDTLSPNKIILNFIKNYLKNHKNVKLPT